MSSIPFINEDRTSPQKPAAVLSQPYVSVPSLTMAVMALREEAPSWPRKPTIVTAPGGYFLTEQRVLGPLLRHF
jgi:hypothetical protein